MSTVLSLIGNNIIYIGVLWYVISAIGYWNMFIKAGEAGWKAFIPLYNTYITYKICWKTSRFWVAIIAMVASNYLQSYTGSNVVIVILAYVLLFAYASTSIMKNFRMAYSFGKGNLYGLGLLILTPVFTFILGSGDAQYVGKTEWLFAAQA